MFITLLLSSFLILAHSWYPPECCSDSDCKPVPCHEIVETNEGYKYYAPELNKDITFSKEQERPSQDGKCHVCYMPFKSYCIFTLQGA